MKIKVIFVILAYFVLGYNGDIQRGVCYPVEESNQLTSTHQCSVL